MVAGGNRRLTLRMNFLWTLGGNIIYAATQWGILVVLAKLGTPQMLGDFALALAITAPVMIGTGLSLRGVQATDTTSEHHFGDYLSLRILTTAAAGLIIIGIVSLSGYQWHTSAIILTTGLAKASESISDIFYGLLQHHERMDRIAASMTIKGILSLAIIASVVYLTGNLLLSVLCLVAVWALILVFYDVRNGVRVLRSISKEKSPGVSSRLLLTTLLGLNWRPQALIALSLLAMPVGIVMGLISYGANIPRYFIEYHLGTRELGIFAALAYPMGAGTTVINALGQSATPRLARYFAEKNLRAFSSLLLKLMCLGLAVGAGGILIILLAGHTILLLLYRPEYAGYTSVFLWLGIAAVIGYPASLLGFGMTAARYFRPQVPVFLTVMLATAAGCAVLVPRLQLMGAAIALVLAAICQALGSAAVILYALRTQK